MQQFKRAQVIMLPTQLNTCNLVPIIKYINGKLQYLNMEFTNNSLIGQHLYIISEDEIKEGDLHITSDHSGFGFRKYKIIATTDTSLKTDNPNYDIGKLAYITLPQPSQQFIEQYIEAYNKGEVITDILVEYEDYDWDLLTSGNTTIHQRVKVNSKDNTITIKKLKDSWNREELKVLFKKHEKDVIKYINGSGASATPSFNDKWIEENL